TALRAVEGWPAKIANPLGDELRKWLDELKALRQRREQADSEIRQLVRDRRLYTARQRMETERLDSAGLASLRTEIDRGIQEAERQLAEVTRRGLAGEAAALAYQNVLRVCRDC